MADWEKIGSRFCFQLFLKRPCIILLLTYLCKGWGDTAVAHTWPPSRLRFSTLILTEMMKCMEIQIAEGEIWTCGLPGQRSSLKWQAYLVALKSKFWMLICMSTAFLSSVQNTVGSFWCIILQLFSNIPNKLCTKMLPMYIWFLEIVTCGAKLIMPQISCKWSPKKDETVQWPF